MILIQKYNVSWCYPCILSIFRLRKLIFIMRKSLFYLLVFPSLFGLISCENSSSEQLHETQIEMEEENVKVIKLELQEFKPSSTEFMSSAMSRLLSVPELKEFGGYIKIAEMVEMLSKKQGSYTVFAPNNSAFDSLTPSERNYFSNPKHSKKLKTLLESHIVEGDFDSATIFQTIKKQGKMELTSLTGGTLIATIEDNTILISDNSRKLAVMQKSDILSSNGIVHVLDRILYMD